MEYVVIIACFVGTLVAVIGHTWDGSQTGIKKLRPLGWIAVIAAFVTVGASIWKTAADEEDKEQLRSDISQTVTDALIILTQELSDKGASMHLVPRVALFAPTSLKNGVASVEKGTYHELAEQLLDGVAEIEGITLSIDFFSGKVKDSLALKRSLQKPSSMDGPIQFAFVGPINDQNHGPLAFSSILQAKETYETVNLIRDVYEKKGQVSIEIKIRSTFSDQKILDHLKSKQELGFGYFYLSSKPNARLLFSLKPSPPELKGKISQRNLMLTWQIGVVSGIKGLNT